MTDASFHNYYIASCVFTAKFSGVSEKIQKYIVSRHHMPIVRCCVPKYKLRYFSEQMPENVRTAWNSLPDCADFQPGDTVYSLCHNCSAVIEESKPGVHVRSLWELILSDPSFAYPDHHGESITVQDCWRAKDRTEEQDAVRAILRKMNYAVHETAENRENTDYCGISLYRPAPPRNLVMAPRRFAENAAGKFLPHTEEEQKKLMRSYCQRFSGEKVVAYCHYCLEGLLAGGADAVHLASLLFPQ